MMPPSTAASRALHSAAAVAVTAIALAGCNITERLAGVSGERPLQAIQNPQTQPGYKAVSLPMPPPEPQVRFANSLWRPGARAFFKDQRAAKVGDILTVTVTIADEADFSNTTTRTRASAEDADLTNLFGFGGSLGRVLPQAITPASVLSVGSSASSTGVGTAKRKETVSFQIAALVMQILPNGNLVIQGHQDSARQLRGARDPGRRGRPARGH
jgi:flagellar L-ring protein precursor FlgH